MPTISVYDFLEGMQGAKTRGFKKSAIVMIDDGQSGWPMVSESAT